MVIRTNLGPWVSEDGLLFSEEKIDSGYKRLFSGIQLIPYMHTITYCTMINIAIDGAPVSLKRILKVDLSYLPNEYRIFFKQILVNKNLFLNIRL